MIYKNIRQEFDYLLWLRMRIKRLAFGLEKRVKTDGTCDFALLARKFRSYKQEFNLVLGELFSLLKDDDISEKTDYIRKESGAVRIRSAYSCWKKEKEEKNTAAHTARGRSGQCRQRKLI